MKAKTFFEYLEQCCSRIFCLIFLARLVLPDPVLGLLLVVLLSGNIVVFVCGHMQLFSFLFEDQDQMQAAKVLAAQAKYGEIPI